MWELRIHWMCIEGCRIVMQKTAIGVSGTVLWKADENMVDKAYLNFNSIVLCVWISKHCWKLRKTRTRFDTRHSTHRPPVSRSILSKANKPSTERKKRQRHKKARKGQNKHNNKTEKESLTLFPVITGSLLLTEGHAVNLSAEAAYTSIKFRPEEDDIGCPNT